MLSPTLVQKFFFKVWKTSGYLDLQPHFHADDSCQTRQSDQWQHSKHMLISRYFFLLGVDRKNASLSLRKRLSFVAQWDFRRQKTSPRKPRSKFLLLFMSIWSLPCSRGYYMYYVCSILQSIFLKQNFTSRTAVRDILTIPSVVSIKGTDQIDCRVYSSISSLRASSPIWANLRSGVFFFFFSRADEARDIKGW